MQEAKTKSSQFGDMALESTQIGFIQKLLKECKQKVKLQLKPLPINWIKSFTACL